jgi:hypothetical protein
MLLTQFIWISFFFIGCHSSVLGNLAQAFADLNGFITDMNSPSVSEAIESSISNDTYEDSHWTLDRAELLYNVSFISRPLVILNPGPRTTACAAKFRSLSSRPLHIWWDDGKSGVDQGVLYPGQETTTNAYEGHIFYFTNNLNKNEEIARVTIRKDMVS